MLRKLNNKVLKTSSGNINPINQNIKFCNWLISQLYKEEIKENNINQTLELLTKSYVRFVNNKSEFEDVKVNEQDKDELKLALNKAFMFFKSIYIDKNNYLKKKYTDKTSLQDAFKCLSDNVDKLTASVNDKIYLDLTSNKSAFINSSQAETLSMATDGIHWSMYNMKNRYKNMIHNVYEQWKKIYVASSKNKTQALDEINKYIDKEITKSTRFNPKTKETKSYEPWMTKLLVVQAKKVAKHLATKNAQKESDLLNEFTKDFSLPLLPLYYAYSRYTKQLWSELGQGHAQPTIEKLMQEYIDEVKKDPSLEQKILKEESENINMFREKYYNLNMLSDRFKSNDLKIGNIDREQINGKYYLTLKYPKLRWLNKNLITELASALDPEYIEKSRSTIKKRLDSISKDNPEYKLLKELNAKDSDCILYIVTQKIRNLFPQESFFLNNQNLPTVVEWYYNITKLLSAKTNEIDIIKNLFGKIYNQDDIKSSIEIENKWVKIKYDFSENDLLINSNLGKDGDPHFTAPGYRSDGVELVPIGKNDKGEILYHLESLEPAVYLDPKQFKKEEILSNISHIVNCLPKGVKLSQIKSLGITSATIMNKENNKILNDIAKASFTGEDYISSLEQSIKFLSKIKNTEFSEEEIMSFILDTPIYHHTVDPKSWNLDPNIEYVKAIINKEKDKKIQPINTIVEDWKESLNILTPKPNWSLTKKKYANFLKSQHKQKVLKK